jgi:hypothetical protein
MMHGSDCGWMGLVSLGVIGLAVITLLLTIAALIKFLLGK